MLKLPEQNPQAHTEITLVDVDEAARIFVSYTEQALQDMYQKRLNIGAAVQAVIQMSMRTYADFLGDDLEAIRQIRGFIDGWEDEVDALT